MQGGIQAKRVHQVVPAAEATGPELGFQCGSSFHKLAAGPKVHLFQIKKGVELQGGKLRVELEKQGVDAAPGRSVKIQLPPLSHLIRVGCKSFCVKQFASQCCFEGAVVEIPGPESRLQRNVFYKQGVELEILVAVKAPEFKGINGDAFENGRLQYA